MTFKHLNPLPSSLQEELGTCVRDGSLYTFVELFVPFCRTKLKRQSTPEDHCHDKLIGTFITVVEKAKGSW